MKLNLWRWTLALLAVLAMVAAGCGDDEEDSGGGGGGAEGGGGEAPAAQVIEKNPANADKSVTIGSKNFPEQYILGNIYAQALTAAGYKADTELDLGDENVAFKALQQGEIDAYPEYTGTSLSTHLKVKVTEIPKEPDVAFQQLVEGQKKNKVTPLPHTEFENTYRIGMLKETAERLGNPTTISDLSDKASELSIMGYPECRQRPDCLLGLQDTYGLKFKKFVAAQDQYAILDSKKADVAMVFTTDANLTTDKYVVLEDDKKLFPPYQVTLLFRDDTLQELGPDAQKTVEQVQRGLNNEVMGELNSRVALDKQKPEKVAADYLREAGFVK
jgi:glycine betaine/choline ABC-type transport system substrate-binding protein